MFLGIERVGSQRRINKDQVIAADQAIGSNTDEIVELNKKIRQLGIAVDYFYTKTVAHSLTVFPSIL